MAGLLLSFVLLWVGASAGYCDDVVRRTGTLDINSRNYASTPARAEFVVPFNSIFFTPELAQPQCLCAVSSSAEANLMVSSEGSRVRALESFTTQPQAAAQEVDGPFGASLG